MEDPIRYPDVDYRVKDLEDSDFTDESINQWIQKEALQREMIRHIDIESEKINFTIRENIKKKYTKKKYKPKKIEYLDLIQE